MRDENQLLWQVLDGYNQENIASFHMPGHKRNRSFAPYLHELSAHMDITEIPNFDDLHEPREILKDSMEKAAQLCGSQKAFYLVNGSTAGILAAIRSATKRFDTVLVARNCHRAVYHAIELCCLQTVFLEPPTIEGFGCAGSITPQMVQEAIEENAEIKLVILTSPTFEGIISDIQAISEIVHENDIPIFVDEAHGAHLGLHPTFPRSAIQCGADLVVQSFHKTLPSLTQSAVLHLNSNRIATEEIQRQLMIFQSSSPSYILLASLDACTRLLLQKESSSLFEAWHNRLQVFAMKMKALKKITLLTREKSKNIWAVDPSKLVFAMIGTTYTGVQFLERLRHEYGIQLEMGYLPYAVAMTSLADTDEMMEKLTRAVEALDASIERDETQVARSQVPLVWSKMPVYKAIEAPSKVVNWNKAAGKLSGSYVWAYPPGVPIVAPGEVISQEILEYLYNLQMAGVHIQVTKGVVFEEIAVLDV